MSTDTSPPPSGWQLQLIDENGNLVASTDADTTDGTYAFENVIPGNYTVQQAVPSGWLEVSPVLADTPSFSSTFASSGSVPVAMTSADFDLDGDIDLAVLADESGGGTVTLFLNDGTGSFTKYGSAYGVKFSDGGAFGLLALDGFPNSVAPSLAAVSAQGWVSVLVNKTETGHDLLFSATNNYVHFIHAAKMHGVTAGDFDGDGITDLAGSHDGTSGNPKRFDVLLMKDGTRIDGKHYDTPGQLAAADINGDEKLDLVLNSDDSNQKFNVAYGDGTGDMTKNITTWCLNGGDPSNSCKGADIKSSNGPVAVSDINADGLPDVLFGTGGDWGLVIQTQSSEGGFFFLLAASASVVGIGADHIQGELNPNPVVLNNDPALSVYEITETDILTDMKSLTDVETPAALAVADLNGDGLPDLSEPTDFHQPTGGHPCPYL